MKFAFFITFLFAYGITNAQMAQPSNFYVLDRSHSELNFSIKWMNKGKVSGTFDNVLGSIFYDAKQPHTLSASLKINIKTLSTGISLRDGVLMKEWFDTASHPFAYFESLPISKQDKPGKIKGNFTLKGITKVITLNMDKIDPPGFDYQNDPFVIISGRTRISRKEFNITPNSSHPSSRYETSLNNMIAISDSVLIEFNLTARQTSVKNSLSRISNPGSRSALVYELVKNAAAADIPQKLDSFYKTNPGPNPNQDISAWLVGTYFIAANDTHRALPLLQKSIEQFPNNANNMDAMMQLYYHAKNTEEAKKWMNSLLALDAHHPNALEYKKRL